MTVDSRVQHLFDSAAGYGPLNLLAVGDPDVCFHDGQWVMHLGGARRDGAGVNLFTARLPVGAPLTSDAWRFDVNPDDPTEVQALLPLASLFHGGW